MNDIFNLKVPKRLRLTLLILAMFPNLMILSMFNMNSTFTASFLDLEADDIQFMFAMAYATIVCGLLIHVRFFHFFNIRSYLIVMTGLSILVLLAMTFTRNTQLLLILRLIQGPLALFEGCILLPIIMSQLKSHYAKILGYSILYCFLMISDKFATSIIKFAIENYNHNMMIYTIIMIHTTALLVYLFLFNYNRMFPKKPLYQLHLSGILLLMISLISGAFFLIYGRQYDWFDSYKIIISLSIFLIFGALFILYQNTVKRPLFHFGIFKAERVILGVLLLFLFYIFRASLGNVYQVMGTVWNWPWTNILTIQYFNVFGTICGVAIAFFLMLKEVDSRYTFTAGFLLLSSSMLWFSLLFYPDVSQSDICYPLLLEGLAQGVLFTPIVLYMLGGVHPSISSNVALLGTATRFWGTIAGYSIMQNVVLHLTTRKQSNLSVNYDLTSVPYQEQWDAMLSSQSNNYLPNEAVSLTVGNFQNELFKQSLLLTSIDIFRILFWMGIGISIACFLYQPIKGYILLKLKA
ncbi:hypothetical protein [Pedobacter sp.]|uniref:hypothetical protein n=1 Tax=Pedobacter sp. TaxID=1411316 RepID=UPI003D7FA699